MESMSVKELMIPLDDYAVVPRDATLLEAIRALKKAERRLQPDRQPARAVLVVDAKGAVVGQLGHLEILQALEPRYGLLSDLATLSRAGVSEELCASLIDHLSFWRGDLSLVCGRIRDVRVSSLMRPIAESVDENAPLSEAIHRLVMWQSARALVTRSGRVVGVLRLADLLAKVAGIIDDGEVSEGSCTGPRSDADFVRIHDGAGNG